MPEGQSSEREVASIINTLPQDSFLYNYVNRVGGWTDGHLAYHVGIGLAALTQVVPVGYRLRAAGGGYCNLYVLLVGESTLSRKTEAVEIGEETVRGIGALLDRPGSPEVVTDLLAEQGRRMFSWPEFGTFLKDSEYGYLSRLRAILTEAYDNVPLSRTTVKDMRKKKKGEGDTIKALNPRLSVMAGCATDFLSDHTEPSDWTGGFFSRFLTLYFERERHLKKRVHDDVGEDYVQGLLQARRAAPEGTFAPCLGMDAAADAYWDQWACEIETKTRNARPDAGRSAMARAPGMAMRIASLLAWDFGMPRGQTPWYLTLAEVIPAIEIVKLHVESVSALSKSLARHEDGKILARLRAIIPVTPIPVATALQQLGVRKFLFQQFLETLICSGEVQMSQAVNGAPQYVSRVVASSTAGGGNVVPLVRPAPKSQSDGNGSNVAASIGPALSDTDLLE